MAAMAKLTNKMFGSFTPVFLFDKVWRSDIGLLSSCSCLERWGGWFWSGVVIILTIFTSGYWLVFLTVLYITLPLLFNVVLFYFSVQCSFGNA